jgi:hypothetical protein
MIEEVKSSKMIHPRNADEDPKRWIRKLQDRIRRGDKSLSPIQFQYVEAVMGKQI